MDGLRELFEEKFKTNEADHEHMKECLGKLNGQVKQNTVFRIRGSVYVAVAVFIISVIASIVVRLIPMAGL